MSTPPQAPDPTPSPPQTQGQSTQSPDEASQPERKGNIVVGVGRTRRRLWFGNHINTTKPYGFRIYRTTYGNDEHWNRFMSYFKANVEQCLGSDEKWKDQLPLVDWNVQTGPELHDATSEQVREKFIQWVDSGEEQPDNSSRYIACIVVDETAVDSVMTMMDLLEEEGEPLHSEDSEGLAYVTLVSADERDEDADVCIQYLYPTGFDFAYDLGWRFIEPKEGEWSAKPM